jgi:drug/metabolite transporter (DMT)-like permease
MNKQQVLPLCATLLWSVNFVIASGIKGHIPPRNGFLRWTIACVVLAPLHF